MKKRVSMIIVSVIIATLLMGTAVFAEEDSREEPIRIGVINFMYGTRGMNAAEEYMDYLEEHFPVEFVLATCPSTDADSVIATVENLITSGVDAIFSYICDGASQAVAMCEDAGIYYGLMMVKPYEEDVQDLENSAYYLGAIHPETDSYTWGEKVAADNMADGYANFATVGFNVGLVRDNDAIVEGYESYVLENGGNVVVSIHESIMSMSEATTTMVANYGDQLDYIFAPAGGANFVLPKITGTDIKICVNDLPDNAEALFATGNLDYIFELPYECIGIETVMAINAVNGYQLENQPAFVDVESQFCIIRNADDAEKYLELTQAGEDGQPLYTAEELSSYIASADQKPDWNGLMELCASNRMEDIEARR